MTLVSAEWPELAPERAGTLLANLGYLLIPGPPLERPPAYLMVALRARPTRRHFDPEYIEYWVRDASAGAERLRIEWPAAPAGAKYSWGTIRVGDRVRAINRFTSFGGRLEIGRSDGRHVAVFRSDAPILDLGEHHGLPEPLAAQVEGFFARIRAAGGDAQLSTRRPPELPPLMLYSAFIESVLNSLSMNDEGSLASNLVRALRSERDRLSASPDAGYAAGRQLARRIRAPSADATAGGDMGPDGGVR